MLRSERERVGLLMDTLIANWGDPAFAKDSVACAEELEAVRATTANL